MDQYLRCNSLRCRQVLTTQAVVTNCSHIFCVDCANKLFTDSRTCPLCELALGEPDDVCLTNLNPTDDYKTVPHVEYVADIRVYYPVSPQQQCSKFFPEQQIFGLTNKIKKSYQEYLLKSLQDKYNALSNQFESLVRESNTEITHLRNSVQSVKNDLEVEKKRNHELADFLHEKTKQCSKIQTLYDKLKRRMVINPLQNAANQSIDLQPDETISHQGDYHHYGHTIQRQPLYPHSTPGQQRTFTVRPPSRQGQGMRSAVVSAAGRTPLERISTNAIMNGANVGTAGYRGGSVKGGGGRIVYGRK